MGPLTRTRAFLMALVATVTLLFAATASASDTPLSATLAPVPGAPTQVRLTLRNDGSADAEIPVWLTGAHGIADPILQVTRNGVSAQYTGILAKHRRPLAADMVTIAPGAQAVWTLDVASA